MLKVAIIGLGQMGRLHLYNCFHVKGIEVVAAADQSRKQLRKAEALGVKNLYSDYHEALKNAKNLDAVVISLPNFMHLESVELALEAGLHVFVEKPLARNLQECKRMKQSVEKSSKKLMVGHCYRFLDAIEKMKSEVENGLIGSLEAITAEMILNGPFSDPAVPTPVPEWWFDPERSGGGALLDIGYHMIDLFRFFAGDAEVAYSVLDYKMNLPMEDEAIVILKSKDSAAKGIVNVGWYQRSVFPDFNFRFIAHGNAGFTSTSKYAPRNLYQHALREGTKNIARRITGRKIRPLSYTYYYEPYLKELEIFFNSVKRDEDPPVTVDDGLKTVEIITKVYQDARTKVHSPESHEGAP